MNKKGFTLVEILSVIVVLGVMAILVFPNAGQSNDIKKEKELENLIKTIENSAKMYHSFNENTYKVSIETLVDEEYLISNITNPVTEELMDGCVRTTLNEEGTYEYNYGSCDIINVPFKAVLNGGSTTQTFQSTYPDSTLLEITNPTREGYTFSGWQVVKGNSVLNGKTLVIGTTETEIYAMWKTWPTLTINYDGGTPSEELNPSYETGDILELKDPTKTGYAFIGWTLESGDGDLSGNIFTVGNENAVIKANWSANSYTYNLVYESSNGASLGVGTITRDYGVTIQIGAPSFAGYTSPSSQSITWDSVSAKTITFTYTPITYTISYTLDGGTVSTANPTEYTIETATFSLNNPTKTGYTFTGWTGSNGSTASTSVSITKGSTGNKTYTANWKEAASIPIFTYSGSYEIVDDSNKVISNTSTHSGNWKIRFLSDGDLIITDLKGAANGIDIFVVGGGGNGSAGGSYVGNGSTGGGGGGGGASITVTKFPVEANVTYKIDIGAKTQNSSFSKGSTAYYTALAGSTPESPYWGGAMVGRVQPIGEGGAGRLSGQTSLYGAASVKANAGAKGSGSAGTYEFNGTSGLRYGAGGGKGGQGCSYTNDGSGYKTSGGNAGTKGTDNTGSGGGGGGGQCGSSSTSYGSKGAGGAGGTGIVIIRNTR